jgi:DNA invertase Pin-like site-specific DNA recombinase
MARIGYARVSSNEQDLTIQLEALKAAGCEKIFKEKMSGTTMECRRELSNLLDWMREGDIVIITKIDRLARSSRDLQNIAHKLIEKGVDLKATDQPIDTSTAAGKAFFGMLGVFAEFETNLRKERQLDGIAKAKSEGRYKGRPATIDPTAIRKLKAAGVKPSTIAKQLKICRASVYRALENEVV